MRRCYESYSKVVFLDLEAIQKTSELLSVGAVLYEISGIPLIKKEEEFLQLVIPKKEKTISRFITELTGINNDLLRLYGVSFEKAIKLFQDFIGDYKKTCFIVFGCFDLKIFKTSYRISKQQNDFCDYVISNFIDFQSILSCYIRDENRNIYSLTKAIGLFNKEILHGNHNPLIDAKNLALLTELFYSNEDLIFSKWIENIEKNNRIPMDLNTLLESLKNQNNIITKEITLGKLKDYFNNLERSIHRC